MSIRLKILFSMIGFSLAGTALLWNFNILFILRNPDLYTKGLLIFVINVVALISVASVIVARMTKPLVQAEGLLRQNAQLQGMTPLMLQKKLQSLVLTLLLVNGIGFFLGPVIQNIVVSLVSGAPINHGLLVSILYATGIGLFVAIIEIRLVERFFLPLQIAGGQTQLNSNHRTSLISRQIRIGGVILYLSFGMLLGAGYGFITEVQATGISNESLVQKYLLQVGLLGLVILSLGALALWLDSRPLARRLQALSQGLDSLLKTSNSQPLVITAEDELGGLAHGFNRVLLSQGKLLSEVEKSSQSLKDDATGLETLGHQSLTVAQGITTALEAVKRSILQQESEITQARSSLNTLWQILEVQTQKIQIQGQSVSTSSAAITEMAASIDSVSASTKKVHQQTQNLQEGAQQSQGAMDEMVKEIENVATAAQAVAQQVSSIAKIAAQTNLLAMNAAIEAAHAGEAGLGFSVVASEVRNLSLQASSAVKEISQLIKNMLERTKTGLEKTQRAKTLMAAMAQEVQDSAQQVTQISYAMEEQGQGTLSIRQAIENVVQVTQEIQGLTDKQQAEGLSVQERMDNLGQTAQSITLAMAGEAQALEELSRFNGTLKDVIQKNSEISLRLAELFKSPDEQLG